MLLDDLAAALKAGGHPEWAGVFGHFGQEVALIRGGRNIDPSELRRLVRNIRLCFDGSSGFPGLFLEAKDAGESAALNLNLTQLRARTASALDEINLKLIEFVN
jgi:hypothetical protein